MPNPSTTVQGLDLATGELRIVVRVFHDDTFAARIGVFGQSELADDQQVPCPHHLPSPPFSHSRTRTTCCGKAVSKAYALPSKHHTLLQYNTHVHACNATPDQVGRMCRSLTRCMNICAFSLRALVIRKQQVFMSKGALVPGTSAHVCHALLGFQRVQRRLQESVLTSTSGSRINSWCK